MKRAAVLALVLVAACHRRCGDPNAGWSYLPLENVKCGRGGEVGIGVNPREGSRRLVLFFVGGGACFDKITCDKSCKPNVQLCAANLDGFGPKEWGRENRSPPETIFDRSDATNPFREDNLVFIPYCTGDFHSGSRRGEDGIDHFGWDVVSAALAKVTPRFAGVEHVIMYGVSAGGFGVVFNYEHVRAAFPASVKVDLIDDSGPTFSRAWTPVQEEMRRAWGSEKNAPPDCAACGEDWEKYFPYLAGKYPDAKFAFASYEDDPVISAGFGGSLVNPGGFRLALASYVKDVLAPLSNVRVFIVPGSGHGVGKEHMSKTMSRGEKSMSFAEFLSAFRD